MSKSHKKVHKDNMFQGSTVRSHVQILSGLSIFPIYFPADNGGVRQSLPPFLARQRSEFPATSNQIAGIHAQRHFHEPLRGQLTSILIFCTEKEPSNCGEVNNDPAKSQRGPETARAGAFSSAVSAAKSGIARIGKAIGSNVSSS